MKGVTLGILAEVAAQGMDRGVVLRNWHWLATAVTLVLSLVLWLPHGRPPSRLRQVLALILGVAGLSLLWWEIPTLPDLGIQIAFGLFAVISVASAIGTVASPNPVYSAIWFALTLVGVAGVYVLQSAQFLGIATIAVYAGAIVVTFLFVLMLSQPSGHATYDRMSWGEIPRWLGAMAATSLMMIIATALGSIQVETGSAASWDWQTPLQAVVADVQVRSVRTERTRELSSNERRAVVAVAVAEGHDGLTRTQRESLQQAADAWLAEQKSDARPAVVSVRLTWDDTRSSQHMARLGGRLFSRQWIAVQGAGALLLAALVGAVAIASRDTPVASHNGT